VRRCRLRVEPPSWEVRPVVLEVVLLVVFIPVLVGSPATAPATARDQTSPSRTSTSTP